MSSLPGLTLEAFLMWNFNLIVDGDGSANPSLQIAEAMGTAARARRQISKDEFAPVVALFEPYRIDVENNLADFDDEIQSWRDYAGWCFEFIPDALYTQGGALLPK